MAFNDYKTTNNATTTLQAGISASDTTLIVKTGEGALFPATYPFFLTLEKEDSASTSIPRPIQRREIVEITNRSTDTMTIVRGSQTCVGDDTANPKVQGTTQYAFDALDKVSLYYTSDESQDIRTQLANEDDTTVLVHRAGTQTIPGDKTFSGDALYSTEKTLVDRKELAYKGYIDDEVTSATAEGKLFYMGEDMLDKDQCFLEGRLPLIDIATQYDYFQVLLGSSPAPTAGTIGTWSGMRLTMARDGYIGKFKIHNDTGASATGSVRVLKNGTPLSGITYAGANYQFLIDQSFLSGDELRFEGTSTTSYLLSDAVVTSSAYISSISGSVDGADNGTKYGVSRVEILEKNPTQSQNLGDTTANEKISTSFIGGGATVNACKDVILKTGSPVDNISLRIETDNAGSPSGTLFDANATATLSSASVTGDTSTEFVEGKFNFSGSVTPLEGVVYHKVYFRTGSINLSNYFSLGFGTNNTTTRTSKLYDGSIRGSEFNHFPYLNFGLESGGFSQLDGDENYIISKTDASYSYKVEHLGQKSGPASKGDESLVQVTGIADQTGLTTGSTYYLSDTAGLISTSAGSNSRKIGLALSDTLLRIQFPPL